VTDTPTERAAESTWSRLRRRKVVQWGLVYVAAAWGFLQGLEYVSESFHWPEQLRQIALLALLIGLPIVLVLAWYHGDRGQQRITTPEFAILLLLLLLGGGAFWYYQRVSENSTATSSPPPNTAAFPTDASIAVLPFVNMSPDKDQEYFADGISEELLNLLAKVPELRVIARTSSFSFKGKDVDITEIARKLNVANVLEGSVRKSGDTLRITAQLVRASDSSHLWSQTYDRQMTDVFKVQDEIAAAVVAQLKIKLLDAAPKTRVTDPRAYAFFLQARGLYGQYNPAAFEQAIALYEQALALDPAYAPAWDGLANAYWGQMDLGALPFDRGHAMARESVNKALAHDPEYPPAYARLAVLEATLDRDLAAAARHVEQGLALDPVNLDLMSAAALIARRLGRLDQSIELAEYLVARDPVSTDGYDALGLAYRYSGQVDKAIAAYGMVLSLAPEAGWDHTGLAQVLLDKGDARSALEEAQKEPVEIFRLVGTSMAYHALGQKAESDAALAELTRQYASTRPYYVASVLAFRDERDRAFAMLNRAAGQRDSDFGALAINTPFMNLHDDPRWLPFLRKHGVAPEQLAAIKFDVKVPK
jgi:TolB-like protein/Tfp pilus assembly protein PilF